MERAGECAKDQGKVQGPGIITVLHRQVNQSSKHYQDRDPSECVAGSSLPDWWGKTVGLLWKLPLRIPVHFINHLLARSCVCLPLKSLSTYHLLNSNPLSEAELAKFFTCLALYAICSLCWWFVCCEEIFNFCVCLLLVPGGFKL